MDRQKIDGLYFATTTSPYKEKGVSSIVARAVDLRDDAVTADYQGTIRGGTQALKAALDAVASSPAKQVLVVAADCRPSSLQGPGDFNFGDGAVALLVGNTGATTKVSHYHSVYSELRDVWRSHEDTYVKTWEDRFINEYGYLNNMVKAAKIVMKDAGLSPADIAKVVFYSTDPRNQQNLANKLGFDMGQVQDSLYFSVGCTGTAQTLMVLVSALEEANVKDKMLVANYGDGADAFILEVTGKNEVKGRRGVKGQVDVKKLVPNYTVYNRMCNNLPIDITNKSPRVIASSTFDMRVSKQALALYGSKCNKCGKPQYPKQRICAYCQSKDNLTPYRFSDKKGTLFTYTWDAVGYAGTDVPPVGGSVINFDGGGRWQCHMTDADPTDEFKIGMPMEMTFRKHYQVRGVPTYIWKSRPVR
jgi:3-hydroxy-3-methylglutaryl CoA synthase